MTTLIVYESLYGNTAEIAEAIAAGVRNSGQQVQTVGTDTAPTEIPGEVTLLVVGGPTHAFSMSREQTRSDAADHGAAVVNTGLREWIDRVSPRADLPVITFDTRVKVPLLPGSAAKAADKVLHRRGFEHAARGESFWVADTDGPLKPGEIERATHWGEGLISLVERDA
ncbi:flavodoxin domain-containing protein [Granulicoccus phenolivorans]|uniref:flavodoxin domain-containing protein n=1 Tax=Granulicoccus phenolivorans TaxID=266854 RepID=UPI00040764BE|nr:flavodoxin domain-containing protein [Granulicoccus phenolivorans]